MQAVNEDVVITIYEKNKKGENKVMFQGTGADIEASVWAMEKTAIETSKKEKQIDYSKYYNCSSIGFGLSLEKAFQQAIVALKLYDIPEDETPKLFVSDGIEANEIYLVTKN